MRLKLTNQATPTTSKYHDFKRDIKDSLNFSDDNKSNTDHDANSNSRAIPKSTTPSLKPQSDNKTISYSTSVNGFTGSTSLSVGQELLYAQCQRDPESPLYTVGAAYQLKDSINVPILNLAINQIIARHDSLRTYFNPTDDGVKASVLPKVSIQIRQKQLNSAKKNNCDEHLKEMIEVCYQEPFDLSVAPLIRIDIISINNSETCLVLTTHHLLVDGWSLGILIKELFRFYNQLLQGQSISVSALPAQYIDYVQVQLRMMDDIQSAKRLTYWRAIFSKVPEPLRLPSTTIKSHDKKSTKKIQYCKQLSRKESEKLRSFVKDQGVTLFSYFLSAYQLLLARYSGQNDIVIGVPYHGRDQLAYEQVIGYFVHILPVRVKDINNRELKSIWKENGSQIIGGIQNLPMPLLEIIKLLRIERSWESPPLFQTLFNFIDMPMLSENPEGIDAELVWVESGATEFDISMEIFQQPDGLEIELKYNPSVFESFMIEQMIEHYFELLKNMQKDSERMASQVEMLTQQERKKILIDWNQTDREYPKDKTITQLFQEQVKKTPDSIALVFENQELTYKQLNQKSNQLARYIRKQYKTENGQELIPDSLIALCLERSLEMVIGILGTLKAGGAYVPIDPSYPDERIRYIVENIKSRILLTQTHLSEKLKNILEGKSIQLITLDDVHYRNDSVKNLPPQSKSTDLAYVIYTSGSTGKPKGVMVEHQSVLNMLYALQKRYTICEGDAYILKANYIFDISVIELFGWFLGGGRLVILEESVEKDLEHFVQTLLTQKVTHVNFVPSLLQGFLDNVSEDALKQLKQLKYVLVGGEAFSSTLLNKALKKFADAIKVENLYGPTEATVYSTCFAASKRSKVGIVPIGSQIDNTNAYILDNTMNPVPVGVVGELYIGGAGLARGYLNQPGLTKECFIESPFATELDKERGYTRLYKTGDLVRWLPDGNIEIIGRIDHQVKIRGFRVELGEIEALLKEHSTIVDTVVVMRKDQQEHSQLIAYYVPADKTILKQDLEAEEQDTPTKEQQFNEALRHDLRKQLPDYMIPTAFFALDKLPLTATGKMDRRKLSTQDVTLLSNEAYIAPRTDIEKQLVNIWKTILGVEKVGINDNFFDLGGNSLLLIQVRHQMIKQLNKNLSMVDFYHYPTISALTKYLTMDKKASSFLSRAKQRREQRTQTKKHMEEENYV